MSRWAAYPARCAAHPAPPLPSFGNLTGRTGLKSSATARKCKTGVGGKLRLFRHLPPDFGPTGPNGPKCSLCMRARDKGGLGERKQFHALPDISGRSGRSGRDPPLFALSVSGLAICIPSGFRTLTLHFGPVGPCRLIPSFNILSFDKRKQLNIDK